MTMILIITLIIVGIILMIAELLLIPGVFIAGVLGLAAVSYASYLGFIGYGVIGGSIIVAINITLLVGCTVLALRSKTWKKIALNDKIDSTIASTPEQKGIIVGQEGKTITRINPMGKANIGGQIVEVSSMTDFIDPNTDILVSSLVDNQIFITKK